MSSLADKFIETKDMRFFKGGKVNIIFDLTRAKEIIKFSKNNADKIVLIDYECFQAENMNIEGIYPGKNIPFLVSMGTLSFNRKANKFHLKNIKSFSYNEPIKNDNDLFLKLKNIAEKVNTYCNKKRFFYNAGGQTERIFHRFASSNFKTKIVRDSFDLWQEFYNNTNFFNIVGKKWKIRHLANHIESEEKIESSKIGEEFSGFFIGNKESSISIEKVQKHCEDDLRKMIYFLNKIIFLIENKNEKVAYSEYFLDEDDSIEIA